MSGMRAWLYNSICFILLSLAMQGTGYGSHTSRTNMGKDVISTVKSKSPSSKSVELLRTLYDTVTVVSQLWGNLKADSKERNCRYSQLKKKKTKNFQSTQ